MPGPQRKILTDGKNGHFKVVSRQPRLTKGKRFGVHLPRFLPMGITPSPFRETGAEKLPLYDIFPFAKTYLVGTSRTQRQN